MASKYFITTPIFYANSLPHLGHLYTVLIADAAQRFQKIFSSKSITFSTGMDEHGLKMQQAATLLNSKPHNLCKETSHKFQSLFDRYSIHYSDFICTTETRHKATVQEFFNTLSSKGYICKGRYEGWYCVSDETFVTEKEVEEKVLDDGKKVLVSKESGHVVEWNSEENYIFKLSLFKDDLLHWLKKENRVSPIRFQEELKHWVTAGLYDLSISRVKNRVSWGVPVPNDEDHTIYVWLDALVNYLTVAGYPNHSKWPPDIQVIGKDILRFHGIYWPAFLMAVGLEPPEHILVHSHWKVDGVKMSKSLGNVICPLQLLDVFTPDAVRYVLLKSGGYDSDRSWNNEHAVQCVNSDLANTLGNLLNRSIAPSLNPNQNIPLLDEQFLKKSTYQSLLDQITRLPDKVEEHFSLNKFTSGIEEVMNMTRTANLFFDQEKPWELKNDSNRNKLESILYLGMLTVRSAAICLQPIVPQYASQLLDTLNVSPKQRTWPHLRWKDINSVFTSLHLGEKTIPFKKIKL